MGENVVTEEVVINNKLGLHARPAGMLAKEAMKFKSEIKLLLDDMEVDAKSILDILSLAASKGKVLKLVAKGEDAKEAISCLKKLIEDGFGEK